MSDSIKEMRSFWSEGKVQPTSEIYVETHAIRRMNNGGISEPCIVVRTISSGREVRCYGVMVCGESSIKWFDESPHVRLLTSANCITIPIYLRDRHDIFMRTLIGIADARGYTVSVDGGKLRKNIRLGPNSKTEYEEHVHVVDHDLPEEPPRTCHELGLKVKSLVFQDLVDGTVRPKIWTRRLIFPFHFNTNHNMSDKEVTPKTRQEEITEQFISESREMLKRGDVRGLWTDGFNRTVELLQEVELIEESADVGIFITINRMNHSPFHMEPPDVVNAIKSLHDVTDQVAWAYLEDFTLIHRLIDDNPYSNDLNLVGSNLF